jgi:hypothetical protein
MADQRVNPSSPELPKASKSAHTDSVQSQTAPITPKNADLVANILRLQSTIGNKAVQRVLDREWRVGKRFDAPPLSSDNTPSRRERRGARFFGAMPWLTDAPTSATTTNYAPVPPPPGSFGDAKSFANPNQPQIGTYYKYLDKTTNSNYVTEDAQATGLDIASNTPEGFYTEKSLAESYTEKEKEQPWVPGIGPKQIWAPDAKAGKPVKYITDVNERASYELKLDKQKNTFYWRGKPIDTTKMKRAVTFGRGATDNVIFVMTTSGKVYIADEGEETRSSQNEEGEQQWLFNHSSLVQGEDIAAAGELNFNDKGELTGVSDKSGHYQPDPTFTVQILDVFRKAGVKLDGVKVHFTNVELPIDALDVLEQVNKGFNTSDALEGFQAKKSGMALLTAGTVNSQCLNLLALARVRPGPQFTVAELESIVAAVEGANMSTRYPQFNSDLQWLKNPSASTQLTGNVPPGQPARGEINAYLARGGAPLSPSGSGQAVMNTLSVTQQEGLPLPEGETEVNEPADHKQTYEEDRDSS